MGGYSAGDSGSLFLWYETYSSSFEVVENQEYQATLPQVSRQMQVEHAYPYHHA